MSDPEARWPSVSVCFPAYNEEATIEAVLEEAASLLASTPLTHEIIVCDDGSTDRTGTIIDDVAARHPAMRVLHHPVNQGIRATFEHLYREARLEFVFLNSTDGQWDTRVLFDLLPWAGEYDIVIASRRAKHYKPARQFVSWGFNVLPRLLFGVSTADAGAVKLTRRTIIERFPIVSQSPFSEAERLIRATRAGYRIRDCPTDTSPRRSGRQRGVSPSLILAALRDVPRVWWALHKRSSSPGEDRPHAHR